MNGNDNNNGSIKNPSQDAQGRWHEMLSTTQVLTGEQNLENDKKQQKKKKKKCCGDRKAQHLRRRERRRQQKVNANDDSEGKKTRTNSSMLLIHFRKSNSFLFLYLNYI